MGLVTVFEKERCDVITKEIIFNIFIGNNHRNLIVLVEKVCEPYLESLTLHSVIGKMFRGLMNLRLNYLERTCSTTSGTACHHENLILAVKYGGGSIVI